MPVTLASRKVPRLLAIVAASIIGAYVITLVFAYGLGHDHILGLVALFDVDGGHNIPWFFSDCLLLIATLLLGVIAAFRRGQAHAARWAGLSAIFFFLALDKAVGLHGQLGTVVAGITGSPDWVYYGWMLPYGVVGLALLLAYIPFLRDLPRATRTHIITAGACYAIGAIGTVGAEVVTGAFLNNVCTQQTLSYDLIGAVNKSLQFGGAVWFIYGLLKYAETELGGALVRVGK